MDERVLLERALDGRFKIVRLVARGGMGSVYAAWEQALARHVAIKVLSPDLRLRLADRERFRREARAAARLSHPNIVPIYASGEASGLPFFIMQYVEGGTLGQRLERRPRLSLRETCDILAAVADALDFAHRRGIIHRDLKPENILLETESGRPLLTDFGVATVRTSEHSRSEVIEGFGTPDYMSPEQVLRDPDSDGRSDLYAVGAIGYQMLTGRPPFTGAAERVAAQHIASEPPDVRRLAPEVPMAVADVITRCLAKSPRDRWPNGRALRDALLTAQSGHRSRWRFWSARDLLARLGAR